VIADSPGYVAPRVVACIVNLACEMAQQGIASPADLDAAVRLGLGYPAGPFEWGDRMGAKRVLELLQGLHATFGDQRYRPSPWLVRRARLSLPLRRPTAPPEPPHFPETSTMTRQAFICDAIRTPFGRYGGELSSIRADDLGAIPLKALMARNAKVDWQAVTDVIYGCANQAGEDNRNVARMAALLAGPAAGVAGRHGQPPLRLRPGRLGTAARAIKSGEAGLMIAGGVESMSRAPFVMPKAESAFSRNNAVYDTTIGWRFINKLMKEKYGVDAMPETAENVATDYKIEREAQDRMALASQQKALAAQKAGFFDAEITPVHHPAEEGRARRGQARTNIRATLRWRRSPEAEGVVKADGTVTAGNASGVNDGACALLLADEATAARTASRRAPASSAWRPPACAARHGHRPRAGDAEGAGAHRPEAGADGRDRAERSLRRAGPRGAAHAGPAGRRSARESQRRRHRPRPPARRLRRPPRHHRRQPAAPQRRPLRACAPCASASARASPSSSNAFKQERTRCRLAFPPKPRRAKPVWPSRPRRPRN
jgi:acetyl-CoA acetyltransferase